MAEMWLPHQVLDLSSNSIGHNAHLLARPGDQPANLPALRNLRLAYNKVHDSAGPLMIRLGLTYHNELDDSAHPHPHGSAGSYDSAHPYPHESAGPYPHAQILTVTLRTLPH